MTNPALTTDPAITAADLGGQDLTSSGSVRPLEPVALAATRAAALACQYWVGRGKKDEADEAATEAMRTVLAAGPGKGTVVIGEGAKDEAPMLFDGEELGEGEGPDFDIAVDPLECTTLCSQGLPGSLATIAFAESGTMTRLGPAFYMDKLVGPPELCDVVHLSEPPEANLERAAEALGKSVEEMVVVVLDKPRHEELIGKIHDAGACVITPPDGDVAGALQPLLPDGGADLLMGIGGTPEGIMTACAVRSLGGCMQARLAPQSEDEEEGLREAGLPTEQVYELDDLVNGDSFFVATGVTGGSLVRSPWRADGQTYTESIVIAAGWIRQVVEAQPATAAPGGDASAEGET